MKNEPGVQLPEEQIFSCIYLIRGQKIILDSDLAKLYNVEVRTLKQAVRRNLERFPGDFMFQLTEPEWMKFNELVEIQYHDSLRSQIVILEKKGTGQHTKYLPFVFEKIEKLEAAQIGNNEQIAQIYQIITELIEPAIKNRPPVGFKLPGKDRG